MAARAFAPSILLVALLASPGAVQAQSADEIASARQHFRAGITLYQEGHYARAIPEFEAALRVKASPGLLFDLAQCNRQLGETDRALLFYRRVVDEFPASRERAESDVWIRTLGGQAGEAGGASEAASAGEEPPAPASSKPAIVFSPGGEQQSLAPTVAPAALTPVTTEPATEPAASERPIYERWWFLAGAGAILVAGTVGAIAATSSRGASPPPTPLGNQGIF